MITEKEKNSRMWGCMTEKEWEECRTLAVLPINGTFLDRTVADRCCLDCAAEIGKVHILGCDCERCPACNEQLISCPCEIGKLPFAHERFARSRARCYEFLHGEERPEPRHTWPGVS